VGREAHQYLGIYAGVQAPGALKRSIPNWTQCQSRCVIWDPQRASTYRLCFSLQYATLRRGKIQVHVSDVQVLINNSVSVIAKARFSSLYLF
jgi:hypothetical protein